MRTLGEEGITGEQLNEWIMLKKFFQGMLEGLRLRRLATGDWKLGQAETQFVGEDVEHVDGFAVGVASPCLLVFPSATAVTAVAR